MAKGRGRNRQNLTEIGRDLLAMEISTIASGTITGRKMPGFPHAIIDVLMKYSDWLGRKGELDMNAILGLNNRLTEAELRVATGERGSARVAMTNGLRHIEQVRLTAKLLANDRVMKRLGRDPLSEECRGVAHRIRRSCDQLKPIVEQFRDDQAWRGYLVNAANARNGDFHKNDYGATRADIAAQRTDAKPYPRMDSDAAIRLRKMWELGTDEIVAQTVVQIDGDTVTRVQRGIGDRERSYLLEVHSRSVRIAVGQWKTLFDAFMALAGDLASTMFGRGS